MVKVEGDATVKAFVKNPTGNFPYMCVYWNKENGETIKTLFSGRDGKMPAKDGTLAQQLINSVELDIADYSSSKYNGGTFAVGNTANSRLEAEVGVTEYVDIPLTRETSGVATNWIDVAGAKTEIVWDDDETSKSFRYALPAETAAGEIALTLYDADGTTVVATSALTCTNRPNSISYPYWLGERTAETLNYGEWTMDLAVAKEKAANENGFVLMNLGGDLWCPDCVSVADSLYADAAFAQWSRDNKVALVAVDVPRSTNLVEASLLTYVAGGKWNKSGAFYRSSKMISEDAAQAQLASNWMFATNTYKLAASSGWRVSVPVMVLLRPDGSLVGHFMAKEGGVADANGIYVYDTAENIARLNELLALANQPGGQDGEAHKDSSTTTLTHVIGASSDSLTLQINDNAWFFKVAGAAYGNATFTATTASDGAPAVSLELFTSPSGRYGDTNKTILASSSSGSLSYAFGAADLDAEIYLRVGAYPNATGSDTRGKDTYSFAGASSLFDVTVTSALTPTPGEAKFEKASDRVMETDGAGSVVVTRTGGVSGVKRVRVTVDAGSAGTGRITLTSDELVWAEGDDAPKTIAYVIAAHDGYDEDELYTISLTDGDATEPTATFALTLSDTDKPMMEAASVEIDAFLLSALSEEFGVYNIQGTGALTLKKSGTLPGGMKLAYDKKTRCVTLSGTPTKAGTYTFSATLAERRTSGTATGPETTFTVVVRDPSSAASMGDYGVANPCYGKAMSCDVPLIEPDSGYLVGTLKVAISAKNRVTAKYTGWFNEKASFSGAVSDYDMSTGTFSARMTKGGKACEIFVDADGYMTACYGNANDEDYEGEWAESRAVPVATDADLSRYAGLYTVTFPRTSEVESVAAGTAYVTLSISANGVAKYAGVMPDGTTLSGSVKILAGEDYALVPIFKTSKTNVFAALLNVLPDAATEYADGNPAIVLADDGTVPYWGSSKGIGAEIEMNAYGGYYAKNMNLENACHTLYAKSTFTLDFGVDALDWTGSAAPVVAAPTADVKVSNSSLALQSGSGVTIKLASATGAVSGKATLTLANGKTLKANFKGAVLLGWEDCNCGETPIVPENRPFASGTCYFTDTVDGVKVTRSIPVDLNVKTDCAE